jgi:hypothetical protein
MQLLRTINVLTLASLLILTGCFGLVDDTITPADGEDSHTHSNNHPPNINAFFNGLSGIEEYRAPFNATHEHSIGANVTMYHSVIDIDGDSLTMGWDIDLDGTIDFNVSTLSGFETIFIPTSLWHTIPGTDGELMTTIAFIAIDSNNAGTSQLIDITPRQLTGIFNPNRLFAFSGEDATGSVTDGTGDDLVRITMSQGGDLNWAFISVKISVDNGAPVTCSNGDASGNCDLVEFGNTGDQFWSVGDGVTIVESGQDLCTTGTCVIKVTITDTREGKTLDETTAIAE